MNDRILDLISNLPIYEDDVKIDAALIVSPINRLYFSKFKSTEGFVFVTRDTAYLIVDFRYYESAKNKVKDMKVVLLSNFRKTMSEIIKRHKIRNILIETDGISLSESLKLEKLFKECSCSIIKTDTLDKVIYSLRMIKSDEEIKDIKIAQEISERAFGKLLDMIKPGVTEKELALELEFLIRKEGADAISFDSIIASGKNSSLPHAEPSDKIIESGDFITIDMGAVYNGYHSDMTRTVALGKISDKQKEVYGIVLKAQNDSMSAVNQGVLCSYIDDIARNIIDLSGYKGCFGHALGHGVGLDIHELPMLSMRSQDVLKPGMIITIEPGIYIANEFGVRIEDMLIVKSSGYENTTKVDKNLIIL